MRFDLVGVPYTSAAAPGGIARAIEVLRGAGLIGRVRAADTWDLSLEAGDGARGRSGLLNESALVRLVAATREAVAASAARARLPVLVGGDCAVVLGALAAVRDRHGACGLLLVDGHEDAWPPPASETGEASDSEVGIALGLVGHPLPEPLAELVPLVEPTAVAMLGPRDRAEIHKSGIASLEPTVALFLDDDGVRAAGPARCARRAVAAIRRAAPAFWLHLDLDVLATSELPAVDYPQPGGLSWEELHEIGATALRQAGCAGVSIAIYNPDLDPDGTGAERIVAFAAGLIS